MPVQYEKKNFANKFENIWQRETKGTTVGQPAWQESSKVKSQSRDFRFIFDEKWRSTLRLKYVGLQ